MTQSVTASSLTSTIRKYADMENSDFVSDAEILTYINSAQKELYDSLIQAYGPDFFQKEEYLSITAGGKEADFPVRTNALGYQQTSFALPSDFRELTRVDAVESTFTRGSGPDADVLYWDTPPSMWIPIQRLQHNINQSYANGPTRYWLREGKICLTNTSKYKSIKLTYTPERAEITSLVNCSLPYPEYIIYQVVCDLLAKQQSDYSYWANKLKEIKSKVISAVIHSDRATTAVVADVYSAGYYYNDPSRDPFGY